MCQHSLVYTELAVPDPVVFCLPRLHPKVARNDQLLEQNGCVGLASPSLFVSWLTFTTCPCVRHTLGPQRRPRRLLLQFQLQPGQRPRRGPRGRSQSFRWQRRRLRGRGAEGSARARSVGAARRRRLPDGSAGRARRRAPAAGRPRAAAPVRGTAAAASAKTRCQAGRALRPAAPPGPRLKRQRR